MISNVDCFHYTLVFNILIKIAGRQLNKSFCPNNEDFSPCGCPMENHFELECKNVSIFEIQRIFNSTKVADFDYILLEPAPIPSKLFIPKDIFYNHRILDTISLFGSTYFPEKIILEIHPEAFRSCRKVTKKILIQSLDLQKLEFSFLTHFKELQDIQIVNSFNLFVFNLPYLPKLISIKILNCTGLNYWNTFPHLKNGIEDLRLQYNMVNDKVLDVILNKIQTGPSKNTLNYLDLHGNALTQIPHQLKAFCKLSKIFLGRQQKPGFGVLKSTISFSAPIELLDLSSCYIKSILPSVFQSCILPPP